MQFRPSISFIIPIYNSGPLLKDCLESVRNQNYPKNKIEIITPDGGSKDDGPIIAKKFGAKVIINKKILAEPGFMLGANKAKGDLIVYMGADNRLYGSTWIEKMITPFKDPTVMAAFPWHRNAQKNTWLTKYFNAFTDPINHFVLGYSCNAKYFKKKYKVLERNKVYDIYDFNLKEFPMLAFDQGFTTRKTYKRPLDTEYDDILPVLDMIKKKMKIAFVKEASNYHFTLERGFSQFSKKMRWIIDNNLFNSSNFGMPTRKKIMNTKRKILLYIWPFYVISIIGPILITIYGIIVDKKREWLYHLPISLSMLGLIGYEIIRVGLLRRKSLVSRQ